MSAVLKTILNKVTEENYKQEENAVEQAFQRYKSLLIKIAGFKGTAVLISFEGTKQVDSKEEQADLCMLEKASLIKGYTKNTNHNNTCRQYELTKKGAELAEKLSKED
jgi:hypothetical protein